MTDQLGDSITIKAMSADGFDIMLCLREQEGKEPLFARTQKALAWFKENDYHPTPRANGSASAANGTAPMCPEHNTPMKPSTKGAGWYCPQSVGTHPQTGKKLYCTHKA